MEAVSQKVKPKNNWGVCSNSFPALHGTDTSQMDTKREEKTSLLVLVAVSMSEQRSKAVGAEMRKIQDTAAGTCCAAEAHSGRTELWGIQQELVPNPRHRDHSPGAQVQAVMPGSRKTEARGRGTCCPLSSGRGKLAGERWRCWQLGDPCSSQQGSRVQFGGCWWLRSRGRLLFAH